MKDHKLTGALLDYKECHLDSNALLLYTHADDVVTLYAVCTHDDIEGKGSKAMAKKLAKRA